MGRSSHPLQVYNHLLAHEARLTHQLTNLTAITEFLVNVSTKIPQAKVLEAEAFHGVTKIEVAIVVVDEVNPMVIILHLPFPQIALPINFV